MICHTPFVVGMSVAEDVHLYTAWFALLAPKGTPAWVLGATEIVGNGILIVLFLRYSWRWLSKLPNVLVWAGYKLRLSLRRMSAWATARRGAAKRRVIKSLKNFVDWLAKEEKSLSQIRRPEDSR